MFGESNRGRVVERIFLNPGKEYYLRELAEETGLAPSTVSRIVSSLENDGVVEVEKDVKMSISGRDSDRFRDLKRSFNLWKLAETGLIQDVQDEAVPEAVVLFGSFSRGEDNAGSDIDLAVVNGRELGLDLEKHEEDLERELNIQQVDLDRVDSRFVESLANGITLRGYLEV